MKHTVKFRGEMKEFNSHLTTSEAVDVCWALICSGLLPEDTCEFLRDLHGRWRQYRNLTDAQVAWVQFYATSQHVKPDVEREKRAWRIGQGDGKSGVHGEHGGILSDAQKRAEETRKFDGAAIVEMFVKARGTDGQIKLLCPAIYVSLGGRDVRLSLAKPGSKNPGCIYIKQGEEYLGKITPTGELKPVRMLFDGLIEALHEFCKDPVAYAVNFGKVTGGCCFCGRRLDNRHSIFNGYGETCADNWSLPYSKAPDDFQPAKEAIARAKE